MSQTSVNGNDNARFQTLEARIHKLELQMSSAKDNGDGDYEEGLNAIRTWEESTMSRINQERAQREKRFSSPEVGTTDRLETFFSELMWKQSTMRRFHWEKIERLEHLLSKSDTDINHEEDLNAIRAWEAYTMYCINQEKAQREEHSSSLEDGTKEKDEAIFTDLMWKSSTMRRFQREKARRLEHHRDMTSQDRKRRRAMLRAQYALGVQQGEPRKLGSLPLPDQQPKTVSQDGKISPGCAGGERGCQA